jgi:hypothetical protein
MVNPGRPQPAVLYPIVSVHPAIHTLLIPSQNCQSARLPHPWRLDPFAVYPDPGPSPRPAPAPSIENLWSYPHPGRRALATGMLSPLFPSTAAHRDPTSMPAQAGNAITTMPRLLPLPLQWTFLCRTLVCPMSISPSQHPH